MCSLQLNSLLFKPALYVDLTSHGDIVAMLKQRSKQGRGNNSQPDWLLGVRVHVYSIQAKGTKCIPNGLEQLDVKVLLLDLSKRI